MEVIQVYSGLGTSTGAKASVNLQTLLKDRDNKNNSGAVQLTGQVATVDLEGSMDNSTFVTIAGGITLTTTYYVALLPFLRINIKTAAASGNITVSVFI